MKAGRALLSSCALALVLAACFDAAAAESRCDVEAEMLSCDLEPGRRTDYVIDERPAKSLKLVNRSAEPVQITEVQVVPRLTDRWGEYCLTLRDLSMHQKEPGYGEVGCTHKSSSEAEFAPLRWGGTGAGLNVPPGMTVYLGGYVNVQSGKDYRKTVHVTVAYDARGLLALRQPREDAIIRCDGEHGATVASPWRNTTDRNLIISGATIFAADTVKGDRVDSACIEVRAADGTSVRARHCDGAERRGELYFPPMAVAPGEYIAGQARNRCSKGQWDWAAYIYTCMEPNCPAQAPQEQR